MPTKHFSSVTTEDGKYTKRRFQAESLKKHGIFERWCTLGKSNYYYFSFKSALSEQNAFVSVSGGEQIIYNILNISRYRNTGAEVTLSFFSGGSQQC